MVTKSTPNKKSTTKPKSRNISPTKLTKSSFNLWAAALIGVVIAGIGLYLIFNAKAATGQCSPISGGFVCNVVQAGSSNDSVFDAGAGDVATKQTQGWSDWGVAFRAPNFAEYGSLPVHRYYDAANTAHFLAIQGSADYSTFSTNPTRYKDEGIFFWAWNRSGHSGTTPIYVLNHADSAGGPISQVRYVDNTARRDQLINSSSPPYYTDGGMVFYAYPVNFIPPTPTPTVSPAASPSPTPTLTPIPTATPVSIQAPSIQPASIINPKSMLFRPFQDTAGDPQVNGGSYATVSDRIPHENVHASEIQMTNINIIRAAAGLPTLLRSPCLDAAALEWSMTMAQEDVLHHSPTPQDVQNQTWGIIDRHCDGTWTILAENVGFAGTPSVEQPEIDYRSGVIFDAFMNSHGHYINIVRNFNIDDRTHGPWIDPATNRPANVFAMAGIGSVTTNNSLWVTQMYVGCINICSATFTTSSY